MDGIRILPPDFTLKQKIGPNVDLSKIFTPERIAAAQKTIDETQKEFVQWAEKDLVELEHAFKALERDSSHSDSGKIEKIRKIGFSLKCQAGTFGYDLGSEVANSLYLFMMKHAALTNDQMVVVRKHIDALQIIFHENILGDKDATGIELMDNLTRLVAKFN